MSLGVPEPNGELHITIWYWHAITYNGTTKEQEEDTERRAGHDCEEKFQGSSSGGERMRCDADVQSSHERCIALSCTVSSCTILTHGQTSLSA